MRYRPPRDPDADLFLEAFDPSFDEVMGEDQTEDDEEEDDEADDDDADEDDEDEDDVVLRSARRRIDAGLMNHVALAHARSMVSIARDFHRLVAVLADARGAVDDREPEAPAYDEADREDCHEARDDAQADDEPEGDGANPREALRALMKQQGFSDAAIEDAVASMDDGGAP